MTDDPRVAVPRPVRRQESTTTANFPPAPSSHRDRGDRPPVGTQPTQGPSFHALQRAAMYAAKGMDVPPPPFSRPSDRFAAGRKEQQTRGLDSLSHQRKMIEDRTAILITLQKLEKQGELPPELLNMVFENLAHVMCGSLFDITAPQHLDSIYSALPTNGDFTAILSRVLPFVMADRTIRFNLKFVAQQPGALLPPLPYHIDLQAPAQLLRNLDFTVSIHRRGITFPSQLYLAQDSVPHLKAYFPRLTKLSMTINDTSSQTATFLVGRDKKSELGIGGLSLYFAKLIAHAARLDLAGGKRVRVLHGISKAYLFIPRSDRKLEMSDSVSRRAAKARIWGVVCGSADGEDGDGFYEVHGEDAMEFEREMEGKLGVGKTL
ncbi:hypothetical protein LTR36_004804 [Oleoguttula mirabilis]|uniref:Uncharacterized protein n=1 Tax=Oleoguttula mirabilis TaxID=1507867 RepID=A0AAV9JFE4_9PEZI|nr:hypothetical protein LTR36_004804 [Oleoguttula mirabilis]